MKSGLNKAPKMASSGSKGMPPKAKAKGGQSPTTKRASKQY
jgi:hypothetical protein